MSGYFFNRRRFMALAGVASVALSLPALAVPTGWVVSQVSTDGLDVGLYQTGPEEGRPVILLHGEGDDIQRFADIAPVLAAQGFRVLVPYLRGHGSTRVIDSAAASPAGDAVLGQDVLDLMNALHIPEAVLAGYGLGGRAATAAATIRPGRCVGLVSVNAPPPPAFAEVAALLVRTSAWRT
ncbi:MAG: AB hydrolase superfamily protein YvaM [Pseudomonas fluorescens]|nr:MAG: AB hydrolase superfamily protein YvaM [Pseudomonas fluorescens]